MNVKNIAGIGLTPRRTAQQQRQLAIRLRLFRQIIVDDKRMTPAVAEILGHAARRIGSDVLQRCRIARRGTYNGRSGHCTVRPEFLDQLHHRRTLLPDGDVKTVHRLVFTVNDLIDDRIDRESGLTGSAIADNQLALPPADRHQCIDRLDTGKERFGDVFPFDDSGCFTLDRHRLSRNDRAIPVDRTPQRIDHTAE